DEPTGNLDSKTSTDIMELFKKINQERGKTIVQVTHSAEAAMYGTRLLNVKDGRVWE
ncbi:MAG TPA: macrolide ABC transporter ATP-binding protein, partial [Firmicutes bacterium]|nr:macrolide ABC transporter ATP-binding protein [Bacillota bacterium]